MKKVFFLILLGVGLATRVCAECYAVWCESNTTLYFFNSEEPIVVGGIHDGQTITNVWSGDDVLDAAQSYTQAIWCSVVANTLTTVVFEDSFKDTKPVSCNWWFCKCTKLNTIIGLSEGNLNTSETNRMVAMFYDCESLVSIDVSKFDTRNVKSIASMFSGCKKLASLDLSSFNTSNVLELNGFVSRCESLVSLDLRSFDTSNMLYMVAPFGNCKNLKTIDLSSFSLDKTETIVSMFEYCKNLEAIYVSEKWHADPSKMTSTEMFSRCFSLVGQDGTTYNGNYLDATKAHYGAGGYLRYKPAPETSIIPANNEPTTDLNYYSLDGRQLQGKPTQKGVYINNGKKIMFK